MTDLASGKLVMDEPAEGVVRLRIANPERRGALDHEILDALAETVPSLDAPCLLLTGTGKVFSAGYDLGNLEGQEFEQAAEKLVAHPFHSAIEALDAYPYPVVAALNGHAIGGGLELAVTCDIRLAARQAKLGMPPAKLGLIYSHTGLSGSSRPAVRPTPPSCSTPPPTWTPSAVCAWAWSATWSTRPSWTTARCRWRPGSPRAHRSRWPATSASCACCEPRPRSCRPMWSRS